MSVATMPARSRPGRRLAAVLLAALLCGPAPPGALAGTAGAGRLLDGAVFDGPTGAEGRKADHIDHVVFADGRFLSVGCARWGFGAADYRAWHEGDVIRFSAVTVSPTHGRLAWKGVVQGDRIEATFVWTKDRILWTTRRAYWFRGIRAVTGDGPGASR